MDALLTYFHWWWLAVRIAWWTLRIDGSRRAFIKIRQGMYYYLELAHRIYSGKLGEIYAYADDGIVYVYTEKAKADAEAEKRDPIEDYEGERIIHAVEGEVLSCPLKGTGKQMDSAILAEFNRGDFVYQMQNSYRVASGGIGWGGLQWVFFAIVLIVIGVVVWKFVYPHLQHKPLTPTPSPSPSPTTTPVYSLYSWIVWAVTNV